VRDSASEKNKLLAVNLDLIENKGLDSGVGDDRNSVSSNEDEDEHLYQSDGAMRET
jgi:hypothetical protein